MPALQRKAPAAYKQKFEDEDKIVRTRLGEEGVLLERSKRDSELQRAMLGNNHIAALQALAAKRSGVYIVRLRQERVMDHSFVVDRNGRVIIESEESLSLELFEEIL